MGKFAKGCLITAGVFIGLGIIIAMIVSIIAGRSFFWLVNDYSGSYFGDNYFYDRGWDWGSGDWEWDWNWNQNQNDLSVNSEYYGTSKLEEDIFETGITELDIKNGISEFNLREWDEDYYRIEISGRGDCEYYVNDGVLYIEGFNFERNIGRNFNNEIDLYIPQGVEYERVALEIGAGTCRLDTLNTEYLHCGVEAGTVDFNDMAVGELELEAGVGSIDFEGLVNGNASVSCEVGSINLELEGREKDFNYSLDCTAGTINLDGQDYVALNSSRSIDNDADRDIILDCEMGSIDLRFND